MVVMSLSGSHLITATRLPASLDFRPRWMLAANGRRVRPKNHRLHAMRNSPTMP